jgi:hypothetical protein
LCCRCIQWLDPWFLPAAYVKATTQKPMKMKKMAVSRKYFQGRHFSFLEFGPFAKEPGGYFKAEGVFQG